MNAKLKSYADIILPDFVRRIIKKIYLIIMYQNNKFRYITKGKRSEFRSHFRFSRTKPYIIKMGDDTATDEYNIWNAKSGDIIVGNNCWFGIRNIVMGPVVIGDNVQTGPNVSILGPRHAFYGYDANENTQTTIGDNVWISTGSIIQFGITIGDNAVVSPGSVVTKDIPDGAIVAGNPARDITKLVPIRGDDKKNLQT